LAASGNITTAANIDAYTVFNLPQTTANIVPTIPNPTNTTAGKIIYINNTGSVPFQISSSHIQAGGGRAFIWTGSAWSMLNEVIGGGTQIKTKTTEQTNNTTTLASDSDLSFTIGANETIVFVYDLLVSNSNSATPDFKAAILGPAAATCAVTISGEEIGGTSFPQASTTNCTTPGNLINNNIAADVWVPYQVTIQGRITSGVSGGTVNFQFAQNSVAAGNPIKIMPGSMLHAYKATGADLAEIYFSSDTSISQGDIVSISGEGQAQIQKTSKKYQSNSLGIVSTKPGMILAEADGEGKPIVVALSGRVPVKVTGENGNIKAGDFITSGSIPGFGMKASDAGQVVGQALNDFVATSTDSAGVVMVFIKNQYYDGGNDIIQSSTSTTLADGTLADRFTHLLRLGIERVTNIFLDMTLWIRNLKTDRVQTKELCIEDVCVTKEQLQQMLMQNPPARPAPLQGAHDATSATNTESLVQENPTSTPATSTEITSGSGNIDVNIDNGLMSSSSEPVTTPVETTTEDNTEVSTTSPESI
jgi:hypothetical protein